MLKPGDPAPPFTAPDHRGGTVRLEDLRGRYVVLWFYPKADTPGCTLEGCGFRDLALAFSQKDAVILGISFDTPTDNAAFAQKFGFGFPLLSDTDRAIGMAYGAADEASAEHPRRVGVIVGPDGTIAQWHAKVQAATFPMEALQALPG